MTVSNLGFYDNPYCVTLFNGNAASTINGLSRIISACKDLGLTWIIFNSNWTNRELSKGTWLWVDSDDLLAQANAAGINVIFNLDCNKPPSFRQGLQCSASGFLPTAQDVQDYATAVATRYNGTGLGMVQGVGVGNEGYNLLHNDAISTTANSSSSVVYTYHPCCDVKWYIAVLQAAAPVIRSNIPNVQIGANALLEHSNSAKQLWMQAFHDFGLYAYCTYVHYHFYNGGGSPPTLVTDSDHGSFDTMRQVMQASQQSNGDSCPIWMTEQQYAINTNFGRSAGDVVDPTTQALFDQTELDYARKSKIIKKSGFYTLQLVSGTGVQTSDGMSLIQGSPDVAAPVAWYAGLKQYIQQYPQW